MLWLRLPTKHSVPPPPLSCEAVKRPLLLPRQSGSVCSAEPAACFDALHALLHWPGHSLLPQGPVAFRQQRRLQVRVTRIFPGSLFLPENQPPFHGQVSKSTFERLKAGSRGIQDGGALARARRATVWGGHAALPAGPRRPQLQGPTELLCRPRLRRPQREAMGEGLPALDLTSICCPFRPEPGTSCTDDTTRQTT